MEQLNFKITLDTSYDPDFHKTETEFSISVNGGVFYHGLISGEKTLEFEMDCPEENVLSISLLNKTPDDVELDDERNILKDKLLHIREIEIDDIDVTNLSQMIGEYKPTDPWYIENHGTETLRNHKDLGWNGSWELHFNTPFYIWLLESM